MKKENSNYEYSNETTTVTFKLSADKECKDERAKFESMLETVKQLQELIQNRINDKD